MKKSKLKLLDKNKTFCEAAQIILKEKLKRVNKSVKEFLKDESMENLHQTRIAVRRLRYNMEVFAECFEKKKFSIFYGIIEHMQASTGDKRDLDVLEENILKLSKEKEIVINPKIITGVKEKKSLLNESLRNEFCAFLKSKEMKEFNKLLN